MRRVPSICMRPWFLVTLFEKIAKPVPLDLLAADRAAQLHFLAWRDALVSGSKRTGED